VDEPNVFEQYPPSLIFGVLVNIPIWILRISTSQRQRVRSTLRLRLRLGTVGTEHNTHSGKSMKTSAESCEVRTNEKCTRSCAFVHSCLYASFSPSLAYAHHFSASSLLVLKFRISSFSFALSQSFVTFDGDFSVSIDRIRCIAVIIRVVERTTCPFMYRHDEG